MQKAQHEQERLRGEGAQARERHAELTQEVTQARAKLLDAISGRAKLSSER